MCEKFIEVSTEYGKVRGQKRQSILGRNFYSFNKVPYMKAPIGKLRFADPQPPERWQGTLDCRKEGQPFCNVNFLTQQYEGTLDGVHLNIYSSNLEPGKLLPVLCWIHGGGIFTGNATEAVTSPDYLMQKDVVLVTVQYRIGIFGFLSLEDRSLDIPGNAQFKDQVMALKWIQNNIKNFGGNPRNVTLFGESWGGGATSYHLISDKSKGLFHKGILMSGTALNNIYTFFPRRDWTLKLCIKLGYEKATHSDRELLEFLEVADEKELVIASATILNDKEKNEEGFMMPFGPTIEPYNNGNAFLTEEIIKMSQKGWGKDIDIMIGNTSNECLMYVNMMKSQELLDTVSSFQRYIPRDLKLEVDSEKRLEFGEILKKHYYGNSEPSTDNLMGIVNISNDCNLYHPMYRVIMSRLTHGVGKTFAYRFDYVSKNNLFREFFKIDSNLPDAIHGDDVGYIFKMPVLEGDNFNLSFNSIEFDGIKLMLDIFTNFATNGNPNSKMLNDVIWQPVALDAPFKGLNISEKGSKIIDFPELDRIKVFNDFYAEENKILY